LRVIGGELRGRRLNAPVGRAIRPTSDRLRESIFNILGRRVAATVVLDLFAGTGAFGIEALSRGARHAVFVDNSPSALALITRNLKSCRLESRAQCIKWNIAANLDCLDSLGLTFDLVFIDPPYDAGLIDPTLGHLQNTHMLHSDTVLIVEHDLREPILPDTAKFTVFDQRKAGKSLVSFLTCMV
jgi:16S rRNA (guanine966-N2)-methyltransferase